MWKITKKSINTLMDIYKQNSTDTVLKLIDPQNGNTVIMEITLKTSLTISEKGMFVDRVVTPCFDENGDFMPQYLEPLFMIALLQMTTNVPAIEDTIPVMDTSGVETGGKTTIINIEKTYELCKAINLEKTVTDTKYLALVGELRKMVNKKLAYVQAINVQKASNSLATLKPLLDIVNDTEKSKKLLESLMRLIGAMSNLNQETRDKVRDKVIPISDEQ